MDSIRWRYQPEFRINVTVEGNPAIPNEPSSQVSENISDNYGVIFTSANGSLIVMSTISQRSHELAIL
jgi:hypothetical protein